MGSRSCTAVALVLVLAALAGSTNAASTSPQKKPKETAAKGLAGIYLSARHAEAISDDARATDLLNRALELDPENEDILRQTYFIAAQVGDFRTAATAAARSIDASPQLALAPLIAAVNAYQEKKYDQAWTYLDKIPAQSAVGFALPMLRAWGMAPRQPAEAALAELAPLRNTTGLSDLFNAMSGMINEYYGRGAQALAFYDPLAARGDQLPPSIYRLVMEGYLRLDKDDAAKALAAKFAASHAGQASDDLMGVPVDLKARARKITAGEGMAEALFAACQLLLQNVNTGFGVQLAIVHGQAALFLNPDLTMARRLVAAALTGRERLVEANQVLAKIKKSEPGYAAIQLQIAENLERMEKPAEALALLEQAARNNADLPDVQIAIGDHMRRAKKFEEAVKAYDRAAALYPNGAPENWQFYYARGIALERTKQWDRADADFRKALKINPDDAGVLNYLGYSMIDRGINIKEGRSLIEKAFKLKPDDGYIIDSLGWVQYLMGENENAVIHLEKAVESNPADPTINDHLGDAYWKAGRKHEAFFQWRRALSLDPEADQRAQLQKKLTQGLALNQR
jgi:tetratricopeptide (TPR) repeat protein